MSVPEPIDWRAVIGLLANPESRAVFAEVAGGVVSAGARDRALARLLAAGLVEEDPEGRLVVAEGRLRASLKQAAPAPVVGVERFLTRDGRIIDYPSRAGERRELLEFIVRRTIDPHERLSEQQLGARLSRYTDDVAALRRYLVDAGLLIRSPDGSAYRLPDAELPG